MALDVVEGLRTHDPRWRLLLVGGGLGDVLTARSGPTRRPRRSGSPRPRPPARRSGWASGTTSPRCSRTSAGSSHRARSRAATSGSSRAPRAGRSSSPATGRGSAVSPAGHGRSCPRSGSSRTGGGRRPHPRRGRRQELTEQGLAAAAYVRQRYGNTESGSERRSGSPDRPRVRRPHRSRANARTRRRHRTTLAPAPAPHAARCPRLVAGVPQDALREAVDEVLRGHDPPPVVMVSAPGQGRISGRHRSPCPRRGRGGSSRRRSTRPPTRSCAATTRRRARTRRRRRRPPARGPRARRSASSLALRSSGSRDAQDRFQANWLLTCRLKRWSSARRRSVRSSARSRRLRRGTTPIIPRVKGAAALGPSSTALST